MLKDITLGQFFPGNTIAHKLDPRTKILLVVLYIIALFTAKGVIAYALLGLCLAVGACGCHYAEDGLSETFKSLI